MLSTGKPKLLYMKKYHLYHSKQIYKKCKIVTKMEINKLIMNTLEQAKKYSTIQGFFYKSINILKDKREKRYLNENIYHSIKKKTS